jgi:hypothetical protein
LSVEATIQTGLGSSTSNEKPSSEPIIIIENEIIENEKLSIEKVDFEHPIHKVIFIY